MTSKAIGLFRACVRHVTNGQNNMHRFCVLCGTACQRSQAQHIACCSGTLPREACRNLDLTDKGGQSGCTRDAGFVHAKQKDLVAKVAQKALD